MSTFEIVIIIMLLIVFITIFTIEFNFFKQDFQITI